MQWKIRLAGEREEVLTQKYENAPTKPRERKINTETESFTGVKVLDSFFFIKFFFSKEKKARKVIKEVSASYRLNKDRAFKLVANQSVAENPAPLRMYLGGVGDTEKSQVIKALIEFF